MISHSLISWTGFLSPGEAGFGGQVYLLGTTTQQGRDMVSAIIVRGCALVCWWRPYLWHRDYHRHAIVGVHGGLFRPARLDAFIIAVVDLATVRFPSILLR